MQFKYIEIKRLLIKVLWQIYICRNNESQKGESIKIKGIKDGKEK